MGAGGGEDEADEAEEAMLAEALRLSMAGSNPDGGGRGCRLGADGRVRIG